MRSLSPVSETCVDGVNENPITTCAVWAPEYQKFMATMRRLTTGCNTGPPMSQWDQLCPKCQEVVKEQGYESELKHGPSFHAQMIQLQAEKKLKQLEDKLHEREESERALQEQMIFLSTWDPIVMSPGHTDIVLQSGGHVINAHRAVLAAKSDVILKKMKGNLDQLGTVTMELQIFPESLESFVRYFYTGHISHRDLKSHASKLLTAAKRYGVRSLQLIAERYIAKHVSRETALSTWELGVDHNSEIIKESVLQVLATDVQDIPKLGEYRTYRSQKDPELLVGLFENLIGRII